MWNRDQPHDVRENLFGGRNTVRVWNLATAPVPPFTAVLACELEPGGSVGEHVQEHFAEIVVGISGTGQVCVDGRASPFSPGRVVNLALGHTLSIANDSSEQPMRYLIIKAR